MTNVDVSIVDIYKIYLQSKYKHVEILAQNKPLRLYIYIKMYESTSNKYTYIYIYTPIYLSVLLYIFL